MNPDFVDAGPVILAVAINSHPHILGVYIRKVIVLETA
jgi:hypothetical protein